MVRGKISRREVEDQSAGLEVISLRAVGGQSAVISLRDLKNQPAGCEMISESSGRLARRSVE
jgi:hypothetical protein